MRPRWDGEEGFTLIELIVVGVISAVVGSIVMTGVVQGLRTTATIDDRVDALSTLERGMERVTRELRAANPLQLDFGGEYDTALTATVTRGGMRIAYRYEVQTATDGTDTLVQTTYTYDLDGNLQPGVETSLVTALQNAELGLDVFTYLDGNGDELVCPVDDSCLTTLLRAQQVKLTLARTIPNSQPLVLDSTVRIRSLRYTSDPTNLGIIVGELQP